MSEYFKNLSKTAKRRYEAKNKDIDVENLEKGDPFLISSEWVDDVSKWPEVEFGQIYVYVIDSPGPYTRDTMKAYSSFEAYQQFSTAGWEHATYWRSITHCCWRQKWWGIPLTDTPHGWSMVCLWQVGCNSSHRAPYLYGRVSILYILL